MTESAEEKIELVQRSFEAIWRGDLDTLFLLYDLNVQFQPLTGMRVESGGYIGHDGVRDYFDEIAEVWDEMRPQGDAFDVIGDNVIVIGRCLVRGKQSGVEDDSPFAWVVTVRGGKVTRHRAFRTLEEAQQAAAEA